MKNGNMMLGLSVLLTATFAVGSGWECWEKNNGRHSLALYNHTKGGRTKVPAVVKIYHNDDLELVRGPRQFRMDTVQVGTFQPNQTNIPSNKAYTIRGIDDTELANHQRGQHRIYSAVLYVNANPDAETLAYKQLRSARLVLKDRAGDTVGRPIELACSYYLKGERQKERVQQLKQQTQGQQID